MLEARVLPHCGPNGCEAGGRLARKEPSKLNHWPVSFPLTRCFLPLCPLLPFLQLSDLLTLVQKAGLTDYLSSPHLAITLFAPSNSALAQKVKQLGFSSLDQLWSKGAGYLHEMFAGKALLSHISLFLLSSCAPCQIARGVLTLTHCNWLVSLPSSPHPGFTVDQTLNDETDMKDLSTYPAMTSPPYQLIVYNV